MYVSPFAGLGLFALRFRDSEYEFKEHIKFKGFLIASRINRNASSHGATRSVFAIEEIPRSISFMFPRHIFSPLLSDSRRVLLPRPRFRFFNT